MMDFYKIVLGEIAKALTNVGFNSPIFAHASTFIEASAVNYFSNSQKTLGKIPSLKNSCYVIIKTTTTLNSGSLFFFLVYR